MIKQILRQKYNLHITDNRELLPQRMFEWNGRFYTLALVTHLAQQILTELQVISLHLYSSGDRGVSLFMPTIDGTIIAEVENERYCLLVNELVKNPGKSTIGQELATFHFRGKSVSQPIEHLNRIGMWKQLWERRLTQMEKVWSERMFQLPENNFERNFLESFPYFIGLTENAIQYLVDTEIDVPSFRIDSGTICHTRYSNDTWGKTYVIKNPFDWVLDHCSRDLAEWTRTCFFNNQQMFEPMLQKFFIEYETVEPLSPFSWRLLYARLLFPLHYFECIENYYITSSEHEKNLEEVRLERILKQTETYEHFLKNFFQLAGVAVRKHQIPSLDWLAH